MGTRRQLSREDIGDQLEVMYRKDAWLEEVNRLAHQYGLHQEFEMEGDCLAAFWYDNSPSDFLTDKANERWLEDVEWRECYREYRGLVCRLKT